MTWKHNGSEIEENDIYDIVAACYDEDEFEGFLNENHDMINVYGYEYEAGRVLRAMDEVAFTCAYNDEVDHIAREIIYNEDETDYMGFGIEYIEDDE